MTLQLDSEAMRAQTAALQQQFNELMQQLTSMHDIDVGTAPKEVDFYRPVLDTIWEAFGEDKLVYGSNWPVSERFASCATVQSIVHDYFSARGKKPLEKVFSKNSRAFYKWITR